MSEFEKQFKKKIKEKPTLKKHNRPSLIYDSKYSFYVCYKIKNFSNLTFESKYRILFSFHSFIK